jgi:hypothetical protein
LVEVAVVEVPTIVVQVALPGAVGVLLILSSTPEESEVSSIVETNITIATTT